MRSHTAGHQNAFFDVIDRALNGPDATRDAETLALLGAWLERPPRDKYVDLHGVVAFCGDHACRPVPVPLRLPADFIWQVSPFQLAGGQSGTIESAGIDYILPYWMARYYSVASPVCGTVGGVKYYIGSSGIDRLDLRIEPRGGHQTSGRAAFAGVARRREFERA